MKKLILGSMFTALVLSGSCMHILDNKIPVVVPVATINMDMIYSDWDSVPSFLYLFEKNAGITEIKFAMDSSRTNLYIMVTASSVAGLIIYISNTNICPKYSANFNGNGQLNETCYSGLIGDYSTSSMASQSEMRIALSGLSLTDVIFVSFYNPGPPIAESETKLIRLKPW